MRGLANVGAEFSLTALAYNSVDALAGEFLAAFFKVAFNCTRPA